MRIIKKLIIYSTIIGALLLSILVVFSFLYQDEIVESVKKELNEHLNAEVQVGAFNVSFVRNFPLASIDLVDVTGYESKNYSTQPDTLFHFEEFSLSFNILGVLNGQYTLEEIQATEGFLNLEINKSGEENYLIFKSDSSNSSFYLNLQKVILSQCAVGFRDFNTKNNYQFFFPNIIAKGLITESNISTALYGEAQVEMLKLNAVSYLNKELGQVDIGVEIDLNTNNVQVSRGFITLRDNYHFEVKGKNGNDNYHYTFSAKSIDLGEVEQLIPEKHIAFINKFNLDGTADLFLEIGREKGKSKPSVQGTYSVVNGAIENKSTKEVMDVKKAVGTFDFGSKANTLTTTITATEFELTTAEGKISGEFKITNLVHPKFTVKAGGNADLLAITRLINPENGFSMSGQARFDAQFSGSIQNIDSITTTDIKRIKGAAEIEVVDGTFEISGVPTISNVNSKLKLNPKYCYVDQFSGKMADANIIGVVKLENWLNYALDNKTLVIHGDVSIDKLDVEKWIAQNEESRVFSLPERLVFKGEIEIGEFIYNKVYLKSINGNVLYRPKRFQLSGASFKGFGGESDLDIMMAQDDNSNVFTGELNTRSVKMELLLEAFNDFDQSVVSYTQIEGSLNSQIAFKWESTRSFKVIKPTILVDANIMLVNGKLKENKLLYSIPSEIEKNKVIALFVNLDEFEKRLHNISFDTITNHFTIENSKLYIPQMSVHSSALTLHLKGWHSFDNQMDYYMNFNLKEVLTKNKKVDSEYGYIKDDNLGNRIIYVHVYTKKGEIEVDLDRNGAKAHRQEAAHEEIEVAKSILKEELGMFKNDTTISISDTQEVFEYEIDLGEFGESAQRDSTKVTGTDSAKVATDSTKTGTKKKKKKKKEKESEFEEWDFEDDDY